MQPKIHLLMTDNELMSGVTVDSNSSMIASKIESLGLKITEKVTIGDEVELIQQEILRLAETADVLLVNGGLGPTQDDLTAECLAQVAAVKIVENAEALSHLHQWCGLRGYTLNTANRKQAMLPDGVTIIPNPVGSAVGFRLRVKNCDVLCTPGVPGELRAMMDDTITPWLNTRFPEVAPVRIRRLQVFGLGESGLQQRLTDGLPDWPPEVEIGFRAGLPTLELKLTIYSDEHDSLRRLQESRIRSLIGDYIVGVENQTLASVLVESLSSHEKKLTVAESCTGGLLAAMITEVPGASAVFEAGFVTYSNTMKHSMLGVDEEVLSEHGAVSEPVVKAMAQGALQRSGADYAIAVSGIAGPDGGSEGKPVGTVWVAWGDADTIMASQLYFPVARKLFQTIVAATGMDLIRRRVLEIKERPRYLDERVLPKSSPH